MENQEIKVTGFVKYDRSGKILWALEELGKSYTHVKIDYEKKDNETPEYLNKNPMGVVPVVEIGDLVMHESNGILAYLALRFPNQNLIPDMGTKAFAECLQWLHFSDGTMDAAKPVKWLLSEQISDYPTEAKTKDGKSAQENLISLRKDAEEEMNLVFETLEKVISDREYLCGRFSVADIAIGYSLSWTEASGRLTSYPHLVKYVERCRNRPAAIKSEVFKKS